MLFSWRELKCAVILSNSFNKWIRFAGWEHLGFLGECALISQGKKRSQKKKAFRIRLSCCYFFFKLTLILYPAPETFRRVFCLLCLYCTAYGFCHIDKQQWCHVEALAFRALGHFTWALLRLPVILDFTSSPCHTLFWFSAKQLHFKLIEIIQLWSNRIKPNNEKHKTQCFIQCKIWCSVIKDHVFI